MGVLVLGTVALDTVKTPSGFRRGLLGGSAVHFSMSARLFTEVHLIAVVGEDFPGRHVDFLRQKGIVLSSLIRARGKTFQWKGEYRGDLNAAITLETRLGVLASFKPVLSGGQKGIKHLFLANLDPDIQHCLLGQMPSPELVGLDSMNYWIEHKRPSLIRLLKKVDIYVANDQEARDLSGEYSLLKAAKCLRSRGPRFVLIKKGEHGALFYCDRFIFSLPGYLTDKVIDPTGAGDTFAGGFMGYLAKAKKINDANLRKAIALGTVAASFSVEGFGVSSTCRLTARQVYRRLAQFRKQIFF